jgi:SAM-dependent methyltransferase
MADPPWYREFFGEEYFRLFDGALTPERTAREVEGIVKLLNLPPGSQILDLCCGHGRIAIPLAQRGYRMTGLDLSEPFLERAKADAACAGVSIDWLRSDMREIPFDAAFDAVINIFTAFAYLESEEDDLQVLRQVRKALKPGGRFLLETNHRENVVRRFLPAEITRWEDGTLVLNERSFSLLTSRYDGRWTLIRPDGSRREYCTSKRLYSLTEFARLFTAAGLELRGYFGGLDGGEMTLESRRLALLGECGEAVSREVGL